MVLAAGTTNAVLVGKCHHQCCPGWKGCTCPHHIGPPLQDTCSYHTYHQWLLHQTVRSSHNIPFPPTPTRETRWFCSVLCRHCGSVFQGLGSWESQEIMSKHGRFLFLSPTTRMLECAISYCWLGSGRVWWYGQVLSALGWLPLSAKMLTWEWMGSAVCPQVGSPDLYLKWVPATPTDNILSRLLYHHTHNTSMINQRIQ